MRMQPARKRSASFSHLGVSIIFCSYHIGPSGTFKDDFGRSRGMLMEYLGDVYISQCNVLPVNLGQILHTLQRRAKHLVSLITILILAREYFYFPQDKECTKNTHTIYVVCTLNRANQDPKVFVWDEISCWYARVRASS